MSIQTKKSNKKNKIEFTVNTEVYPLEAIYQTAYVFTKNHYIKIDGNPNKKLKIKLKEKNPNNEKTDLEGEFSNEILNQTIRNIVHLQNAKSKESIILKALISASGNKEYDDLIEDLNNINEVDIDAEIAEIEKELEKEKKVKKSKK